jgi:hypothetical protein
MQDLRTAASPAIGQELISRKDRIVITCHLSRKIPPRNLYIVSAKNKMSKVRLFGFKTQLCCFLAV